MDINPDICPNSFVRLVLEKNPKALEYVKCWIRAKRRVNSLYIYNKQLCCSKPLLVMATEVGYIELMTLLLTVNVPNDVLFEATVASILSDNIDTVKVVLRNKTDMNRCMRGMTPLFHAIMNNTSLAVIQYMVENGADLKRLALDYNIINLCI